MVNILVNKNKLIIELKYKDKTIYLLLVLIKCCKRTIMTKYRWSEYSQFV